MSENLNPKTSHKKRNIAIILTPSIIFIILIFPIPVDQPEQQKFVYLDDKVSTIQGEQQVPSFDISMENNQMFISKNDKNGTHIRITVIEGASTEGTLLP